MSNISVGISAYNEEKNIKKLINKILEQETYPNNIVEIIVISDGSTDKTIQEIKSIKNSKIKLVDHKERKGKMARLNEIFATAKGDIIILVDADSLPKNANSFGLLIEKFSTDKTVFVSGYAENIPGNNFVENSINIARAAWDSIRKTFKNGNSVYAYTGKFYGVRKEFAKKLRFPTDILADQGYVFLECKRQKLKSKVAEKAVVLFKSPDNIRDHVGQITRYESENILMKKYFGALVDAEYTIPKKLLLKSKFKQLTKYPIHALAIHMINIYAKLNAKYKSNIDQRWSEVKTSKGLTNAK